LTQGVTLPSELRSSSQVELASDDLYVTSLDRLSRGIAEDSANFILNKPNQVGTISETIAAIKMAREVGWTAIASHRPGETEDATIADLAVAMDTGLVKTGAPLPFRASG